MTDDQGLHDQRAGPRPTEGALELFIRVEREDLFAGSIRVPGRSTELGFAGWIEFMSLVNALRARPEELPGNAGTDPE